MNIDRQISEAAFRMHGKYPWLDEVARFFARAVLPLMFVCELIGLSYLTRMVGGGWRLPVFLLVAAWMLCLVLEMIIGRKRPFRALGKKALGTFWVPTASMPSSHSGIAFALAVPMFFVSPWVGVIALVLAIGVAASRVYVGVHYLSDVIVGAVLGSVLALFVIHIFPL